MNNNINLIAKSTTIHILNYAKYGITLPSKIVYLLANTLYFTRLDYCSILLTNSTKIQLERIKKSTARFLINDNLIYFYLIANVFSTNCIY